jgi:hypothetical protein
MLLLYGKNKIGNYLRYAIGEVILKVISVLVALSANDWNKERITRIQIKSNLKSPLHTIQKS